MKTKLQQKRHTLEHKELPWKLDAGNQQENEGQYLSSLYYGDYITEYKTVCELTAKL